MQLTVIIVAGGSGLRMQADLPKQFMPLVGYPLLMHTFWRFHQYNPDFNYILVIPDEHRNFWKDLCQNHAFNINHTLVSGGRTRFHSVQNALKIAPQTGSIAVQDGVRPLVSATTLQNTLQMAAKKGNAIPVVESVDSVRQILPGGKSQSIDRSTIRYVQTPQVFDAELIQAAYRQAYTNKFTDDASVVENRGVSINLSHGNPENIKITRPADLKLAEYFYRQMPLNRIVTEL